MSIDIALIAGMQNIEKTITLIKSVCFHHASVKFHIIHADIPTEWFAELNSYLHDLDCEAIAIEVNPQIFVQYEPLHENMSFYGYLKLSIPQLIDVERVLFLNNECIVNASLKSLWKLNLSAHALAASPDLFLDHLNVTHHCFPDLKPYFNAGVLLFNVNLCRNSPFYWQMYRALKEQKQLPFAEQDVLNLICVERWYPLSKLYNFQAGIKYIFEQHQAPQLAEEALNVEGYTPKIIQYNEIEPFNEQGIEVPYEEVYIFYEDLEWKEIKNKRTWKTGDAV